MLSRYGMSAYVLQFNHLTAGLEGVLPPSDTRLRPDLRLPENGILDQVRLHGPLLDQTKALALALSVLPSCSEATSDNPD